MKLVYDQTVFHNIILGLGISVQHLDLQSCIKATNGVDKSPSWNLQLLRRICIFFSFCVAKEMCACNEDEFEAVHTTVGPMLR